MSPVCEVIGSGVVHASVRACRLFGPALRGAHEFARAVVVALTRTRARWTCGPSDVRDRAYLPFIVRTSGYDCMGAKRAICEWDREDERGSA
jgi:hypothetical protein